jgi:hypothetical protein
MKFNLEPYEGAGCIRFGMKRPQLHKLLVAPERSRKMRSGEIEDRWQDYMVRYSQDAEEVVEIEFKDNASVECKGINVFTDPDAFRKLVSLDGEALLGTGTVVLLNLGISTWNLDDLSSPRSLCLFCRGRWDDIKHRLTPYIITSTPDDA